MKTIPPGAMGSFLCGLFALLMWWTPYLGVALACVAFFQAWRAQRHTTLYGEQYSASYLPLFGVSMAAIGFVGSLFVTLMTLAISSLISSAGKNALIHATTNADKVLLW
jgi:hypothetical protein